MTTPSNPVHEPVDAAQRSVVGVHVRDQHGASDYSLSLTGDDVTVAEVFDALGLAATTRIDGHLVATPAQARAVDVLASGSQLDSSEATPHDTGPQRAAEDRDLGHVEVAVVGGLDAGRVTQLGRGLYRLGESADRSTAGWYLEIDHPELSTAAAAPWHQHAPSLEAVVSQGFAIALARPVDSEAGYTGHVHRPPRAVVPETVEPIEVVEPPPSIQAPPPLSWATLLAPIPIALMMAFFFRPIFALFAAMGPVMAIGRWYESRRRFRRDTRKRNMIIAALIGDIARAAAAQREQEARRRWLAQPHVGELWRRARAKSVRLWERRPEAVGYMVATVGVGLDLVAPLTNGAKHHEELHGLLDDPLVLRPVPHTIDLAMNSGVGVHGDRAAGLAMVRSIVMQLVTLHGPADLRVGVLCAHGSADEWDWVKWLPHIDPNLTAVSANAIAKHFGFGDGVAASPAMRLGSSRVLHTVNLVIVDDPKADVAAIHRAAQAADQDVRCIALAELPTMLPAVCSSLVHAGATRAEVATPELDGRRAVVCPVGIARDTAAAWARSLTSLTDPEVTDFPGDEHAGVSLLRLVGFTCADDLARHWSSRPLDAAPTAVIGMSDDGPFRVNLTEDGPHALIAGTTGSGKSELLRTLVLALAFECPPEQLNFVLIDFKGGGAFDVVDQLPHVAGLITDLDETMVERAISSMRAELQRRETLFRKLGVSSYEEAARQVSEPMARLLIIIDEFAALATDYAEQMTAIIDLAARGRSLGMHLVLATQRPTGVVDQKIRANTNLRVALRVQDPFDSQDVIGTGDAAHIDRKSPGRAMFVVGGDAPVTVQTAFSGALDKRSARCEVRTHSLFGTPTATEESAAARSIASELQVLVGAIAEVSEAGTYIARPLWSEPLPATLDWIDLGARELEADSTTSDGLALGLADIPDQQRQQPWRWNPDSGPLALYGSSAECAGKVLVSLGAALASADGPGATHIYVIDGDAGTTAALDALAHTGAYVGLTETDRSERVVRLFETTLAQRRTSRNGADGARMILMIDNLAAVLSMHNEVGSAELVDRLSALARDGSPQRIHLVVTARSVRDIGHRLAQQIPHRLVLALADPSGYLTLGLKMRDVGPLPPMRAIDMGTRRLVQLVAPPDLSSWANDAGADRGRLPQEIGSFPDVVSRHALDPARITESGAVSIPVGIEALELGTAALILQPGEHAIVVAPNGMGRSTTIATILTQLATVEAIDIVRVGPAGSWILDMSYPGSTMVSGEELQTLVEAERSTVVMVDDADRLPAGVSDALAKLLDVASRHVRVIAATTPDFARSLRSWINPIRTAGTGIMIGGHVSDGELFNVRFGRVDRLGVLPGRGHLVVRGRVQTTQFAGRVERGECT